MRRRLFHITTFVALVIVVTSILFVVLSKNTKQEGDNGEYILSLNEIEQLTKQNIESKESYVLIKEKINQLQEQLRHQTKESRTNDFSGLVLAFACLCVVFLYGIFYYIYHSILSPFEKMKKYATEIASGNFDLPLDYERSNYFGEFTWSFD